MLPGLLSRRRAELCEIGACGNIVVLISLVSFQLSEFDAFEVVLEEVIVVLCNIAESRDASR
jgi:hypothetical protein